MHGPAPATAKKAKLAGVVVAAVMVAACSVVAGLGPEAHLEAQTCKAPKKGASEKCSICVNTHCCELASRCGDDPACAAILDCLVDCVFQPECTTECNKRGEGFALFNDITSCSVEHCVKNSPDCLPGPHCNKLGACCLRIADAPARTACSSFVNGLDETECASKIDLFCVTLSDASADR